MSELVCGVCAYTGHVSWDSAGNDRQALDKSTYIKLHPANRAVFTCLKCGTEQPLN